MEKSENIEVGSMEAEVAETKAEFTGDPDEAWLDDLLSHLNAMEEWNYKKNASKVLMEDTMCKLPSQESHWNQVEFCYPSFLSFGALGTENYSLTELKMDVPPQKNTEPGAGSDKEEAELGILLKNAGTQTKGGKTTRDAGIQVRIKTPAKGSTLSGKHLANCK